MTNDNPLLVEIKGPIGWITLNRPHAINAVNDAIRTALPEALLSLDANGDVGAIIIHGAGARGFSAGADLKEQRPVETLLETRLRLRELPWVDTLDRIAKPTIAAVHGVCMGGGFELALACDIRIASKDAVFALPEVGIGLIPGAGGTQRLSRIAGLGRAMDMILTGSRCSAVDAYGWGIVSRLAASKDTLLEDAANLARSLAEKPAAALALAKEAARLGHEVNLAHALRIEQSLYLLAMSARGRTAERAGTS